MGEVGAIFARAQRPHREFKSGGLQICYPFTAKERLLHGDTVNSKLKRPRTRLCRWRLNVEPS